MVRSNNGEIASGPIPGFACIPCAILERSFDVDLGSKSPGRHDHLDSRLDGAGGLSTSRVRAMRTILNLALDHAVQVGLVPSNVVTNVKPPRQRTREQRIWGAAEIERYLAVVAEDPLCAMWHVAIGAGLRRA